MPKVIAKKAPTRKSATPARKASTGKGAADAIEKRGRRGSVNINVLAELQRGLMIGAFVPGQVLSLRKLAGYLGTSVMPVREALSYLVAANVLEYLPNRSVRVPRISEKRLREMTEVRSAIEGIAARMAATNCTPQLIAELERINTKLTKAISQRDVITCLQANQNFHFHLYKAASSEVLMPLIESLWLQCGPTMYYSLMSPNMPWDASAHGEIIEALAVGDASAVQRAIVRDIRTTLKNIIATPTFTRSSGPSAFLSDITINI